MIMYVFVVPMNVDKILSPFIMQKSVYDVLLKLLKLLVRVQKADIAKRTNAMKMGKTPSMILKFIGTATASVLVITLYECVFAKYLEMEIQWKAQPSPMNSSV